MIASDVLKDEKQSRQDSFLNSRKNLDGRKESESWLWSAMILVMVVSLKVLQLMAQSDRQETPKEKIGNKKTQPPPSHDEISHIGAILIGGDFIGKGKVEKVKWTREKRSLITLW